MSSPESITISLYQKSRLKEAKARKTAIMPQKFGGGGDMLI